MAEFSSPDSVYTVVNALLTADQPRAYNRALINDLYNGLPPFSEQEARENKLQTNVNFLEGPNIIHNARTQLSNAFLKPGYYFNVNLDAGPPHLRRTWSRILTQEINRILKRSLSYTEQLRSTHAQIVLHGIGPALWENPNEWCPYARGIEDVLVPSGTFIDMENLSHFAVFRRYTAAELYRKTHGDAVDPGWDVPLADKCIATLSKQPVMATNWNDWRFPEKLAEDIKENMGFYGSDAVPTLNCWDFYYLEKDGETWCRKVIIDSSNPTNAAGTSVAGLVSGGNRFLYDPGKRYYAKHISEILHVQFADCSNIGPFRWHSVRSLGILLYNVCHLQNRMRSRFTDAQQMELMWFFRNVPEEDREKLLQVQLYHMGIIPRGVDFVTGPERFHPDINFIMAGLQQNRQLMSENSASFVQDVTKGPNGTEETATLTMAKVNASSALIGSMLNLAYTYQTTQYREICRRFCVSEHEDCVSFRERCLRQGVPEPVFDVQHWDIEPERVLGMGNKTLEIAQADKLMAARNFYDPEAQRHILHIYTEANSDDPKLADLLVPINGEAQGASKSQHDANLAMGTLMQGLPVVVPRDTAIIDYVETILGLLHFKTQQIEKEGGMVSSMDELRGLINVTQHVRPLIEHIAQDRNEKQRVKIMMDVLGQSESLIKAFAQRWQEQNQDQLDPETVAKVQSMQALTGAKLQTMQQTSNQKLLQKEIAFRQKTAQKDATTAQQLRLNDAKTASQLRADTMREMQTVREHQLDQAMTADEHSQAMRHAEEDHAKAEPPSKE